MPTAIGSGTFRASIVHQAGQHARHQDVENGADHQRSQDADRHVALGILRLLRGRRNRVKSNVGEEDHARARDHSRPAILSELAGIRRKKRSPVGGRQAVCFRM